MMIVQKTQAFDLFYRRYRLYVHDLCRKRFAQEEDVLDLESLVWTEVHRSFERFQIEEPRRLLHKLTSWRAKDLYRKRYRAICQNTEFVADDESLVRAMAKQAAHTMAREDSLALAQILSQESAEDRALLFDRFVEGLTWEELADKTKLHRNTLQKRANASLARLRKLWKTA